MWDGKTFCIPEAKGLNVFHILRLLPLTIKPSMYSSPVNPLVSSACKINQVLNPTFILILSLRSFT